jgi:hypothetical protein
MRALNTPRGAIVIPSVESMDVWLDRCLPVGAEATDLTPLPDILSGHCKRWTTQLKLVRGKAPHVKDATSGRRRTMKLLKVRGEGGDGWVSMVDNTQSIGSRAGTCM